MGAFRDNAAAGRYELDTSEGVTFATYSDGVGVRAILHVETPPAGRGKGYASEIMREIVIDARAKRIKLSPRCSFAADYLRLNPAPDVEA